MMEHVTLWINVCRIHIEDMKDRIKQSEEPGGPRGCLGPAVGDHPAQAVHGGAARDQEVRGQDRLVGKHIKSMDGVITWPRLSDDGIERCEVCGGRLRLQWLLHSRLVLGALRISRPQFAGNRGRIREIVGKNPVIIVGTKIDLLPPKTDMELATWQER